MDVFGFYTMALFRTSLLAIAFLVALPSHATSVFLVDTPPKFNSEELNVPTLTPYEARYQTSWRIGWFSFDVDATQRLIKLNDDEWKIEFNASSRPASMTETSTFRLENQQLQSLEYRFRSGGMLMEADRTLLFDWSAQQIIDQERNTTIDEHWHPKLQDNLTYMQQARLDLANGLEVLEYPVYEKNRTRLLRFERIGEERLKTAIGVVDTIKVQQIRSGKRKIYAWFAKDRDYLLVRLSDYDDGKKRSQIDIRSYQPETKKATE